ncbi:carbohydrate ABC transporter permease [Micromonospora mirobrigensis]|uniref:Multiple sugar transport system permease protein n=1 Tax=Micromonospora mirobrigensis TaxID=262898 RepID=A0A1C4YYY6_9ACTN|nr:sugar ABC transporter permease [Micromonospora mirobrigensis]SCF25935.1 multiple sugar transport system permease protein [Micromonospora mirobrigensis]
MTALSTRERRAGSAPHRASRPQRPTRRRPRLLPFAVPATAIYLLMVLIPMVLSFYYSFTDRSLLYPGADFVGVDNYRRLLTDPAFLRPFGFTTVLTIAMLVLPNAAGLAVAMLLDRVGRFVFALRLVFFVPAVLSGVIVAFLWSTILTDDGLLNHLLGTVGLDGLRTSWLGQPRSAQTSVVLVSAWQAVALCVVVYLAGLQTIPRELYDAARIDGAGAWQAFRRVTWPLLAPALTINSTLLLINGFKTYDIPVVLNGTGPAGATRTIATEVIRVGFTVNRAGLASAMAVVMLVVVGAIAAITLKLLQRREVSS